MQFASLCVPLHFNFLTGTFICTENYILTLKVPEKLQLYGLYVYYVVHICDFGMLRVKFSRCSGTRSQSQDKTVLGSWKYSLESSYITLGENTFFLSHFYLVGE